MCVLFNVRGTIRYLDIGRAELGRPDGDYLFPCHGASATQLERETIVGACIPMGSDVQRSWVCGEESTMHTGHRVYGEESVA